MRRSQRPTRVTRPVGVVGYKDCRNLPRRHCAWCGIYRAVNDAGGRAAPVAGYKRPAPQFSSHSAAAQATSRGALTSRPSAAAARSNARLKRHHDESRASRKSCRTAQSGSSLVTGDLLPVVLVKRLDRQDRRMAKMGAHQRIDTGGGQIGERSRQHHGLDGFDQQAAKRPAARPRSITGDPAPSIRSPARVTGEIDEAPRPGSSRASLTGPIKGDRFRPRADDDQGAPAPSGRARAGQCPGEKPTIPARRPRRRRAAPSRLRLTSETVAN